MVEEIAAPVRRETGSESCGTRDTYISVETDRVKELCWKRSTYISVKIDR